MTKTLRLFSLLFMFVFSMSFAISDESYSLSNVTSYSLDKYRLYVTNVDPEFHCFELSNGMICYTIKKEWKSKKLPVIGTEIHLLPMRGSSRTGESKSEEGEFFAFYFSSAKEAVLRVWILPESQQKCLSYVSSQLVCTQPAGWFFSAVDENIVELSDGSKWICSKDDDYLLQNFNHGDRVIVTHHASSDKCCIINITTKKFYVLFPIRAYYI